MTGRATAPASSGNLGPGFDALALALELRCAVTAEAADSWLITQTGESYEPNGDDYVRRAVSGATGGAFRMVIDNAIPRARGLGSSAAVTVAAAAAALRALGHEPTSRVLFEIVADLEGHADNAAAAVYGGLVAVADGVVRHLAIDPGLRIVIGIPDEELPTADARRVLSPQVERAAAARNLARVVLLVEGLRTADPEALGAAAGDELHEAPRHDLSPVTARLMDAALAAGALHSAWSGAGPSAIAFAPDAACDSVQDAMAAVLGVGGEVRCLEVATEGWR